MDLLKRTGLVRAQRKDVQRISDRPVRQSAKAAAGDRVGRSPASRKFGIPLDLPPMEAKLLESLPADGAWQYEPK
jgi:hypothetical protein